MKGAKHMNLSTGVNPEKNLKEQLSIHSVTDGFPSLGFLHDAKPVNAFPIQF
jgi:hypothetical protein